jgi:Ca2+-binding RTX toxin-like protein
VDDVGDRVIEDTNAQVAFALGATASPPYVDPAPLANALEGFIDTVIAAISFSLGNAANVENLLLAAASAGIEGTGNELDNMLVGNELANLLEGREGNDTLDGGEGDDILDGGPGVDVASYSGNRTDYAVSNAGTAVSGPEGNDLLVNVERIHFANRSVAFDLDLGQATGNAVRVIGAAFDAPYNNVSTYVGIAIDLFESGLTVLDVCAAALSTPLYLSIAGSSSNEAFVTTVYRNVVGVAPPASDLGYFVSLLQGSGGSLTQAQLLEIAATLDLNEVNINLAGLQQTGVDFV